MPTTNPQQDPIMDPASDPVPTTDAGLLTEGTTATGPKPRGMYGRAQSTTQAEPTIDNKPPPLPKDVTYTPSTGNVSPLASDHLATITNENSPLMQQAATKGQQYATSRGLLNSSLGAQASQQAVIAAASPLATSNATFAQNKILQNDRLAIQIMESDMTSGQKNIMLDFLLSGESRKSIGEDPGTDFTNYEEVKQHYESYAAFIGDSNARGEFRVGEAAPVGTVKVATYNSNPYGGGLGSVTYKNEETYPEILAGMGVKGQKSSERANAQKIYDIYGSWANAMHAARMWGGSNLSDSEAKAMIMASL